MLEKKALTISLIIPVYNEESHLKSCLDSVAMQTVHPLEVIVVDNNSSDASLDIAKKYNFVKILHEGKQGVVYARNRGFNAAKGDVIGRIDADSILEPEWVERVLSIFANKKTAAATGPVNYYDMPLKKYNGKIDHLIRNSINQKTDDFAYLFGTNMAIRRLVWQKYKQTLCQDNAMHEDLDLAIHLYKAKQKIVYCKDMVVGMSARRYDDAPRDFYRYIAYFKSTFDRHHLKSPGVKSAMTAFMLGYFAFRPLRLMYDSSTDSYSLGQLLAPKVARKHPMDQLQD